MSRGLRQDVTPRSGAPKAAAPAPSAGAKHGIAALAMAAMLAAPFVLAWGGWRWLTSTRGFAVRKVTFIGTTNADEAQLAARTGAVGRNALGLDLGGVRRKLMQDPWIAEATVRRQLPHELRVSVTERVPAAIETDGKVRRVLDAEGRVLLQDDATGRFALPEIRGIASRPRIERDAARARAAATLAALQAGAPELFARAVALDATDGDKLVLVAADCPPIWLSGPESADEAAAWARRSIGIGQAIGRAAWVDARWRDRLYVMPERS